MTVTANGQSTTTRHLVNCRRTDLPLQYRRSLDKVLAIRRPVGDWIGFWPNPTGTIQAADQWGWRIPEHMTTTEIEALGIRDLVDTHRGWFIQGVSDAEAIVIGPDPYADATVEDLKAEIERLKREHEAFIDRASDILGSEANDHDLCETYDNIAERAGLRRRPRPHDVEIEVTYRQTVTLAGRSWEEACRTIKDQASSPTRYFSPGSPFQDADIEEYGSTYSLKITVPDFPDTEVF